MIAEGWSSIAADPGTIHMSINLLPVLGGRRLRLSPNFKMVAGASLKSSEKQQLGLVDGTNLDTILVPLVSHLPPKAVCRNTRTVLETILATADSSLEFQKASQDPLLFVRLILDSVLEIEQGEEFVCGCAAHDIFWPTLEMEYGDSKASSRISLEALQYADALKTLDAAALSVRLYLYNRIPLSPNWVSRFDNPAGLSSLLGIDAGKSSHAWYLRGWNEVLRSGAPTWRFFRFGGGGHGGQFKLYINPRTDCLREVIETVLPILSENEFEAFKVGSDLRMLLRPDKFVAYARSQEQIYSASRAILSCLTGVPVQTVPFTAGIDEDGLLTWGADPPHDESSPGWRGTSWRGWITGKLASTLVAARSEGCPDPVFAALRRLSLDGVNPRTWTPDNPAWDGTNSQ